MRVNINITYITNQFSYGSGSIKFSERKIKHFTQIKVYDSGVGSTGAVGAGAPSQKMYHIINDHVIAT